jgi:urea transporter
MTTAFGHTSASKQWLAEILQSYAQIFFAHSRWTGVLFVLATATCRPTFVNGILAVVVASAVARGMGLDAALRSSGCFG